jgi:membrane AbrB-like protein
VLRWGLLAALVAVGTVAGEAAGIPSAAMLVGLLVGLAYALHTNVPLNVPTRVQAGAQTVTGAAVGTYLTAGTISNLGSAWAPVVGISLCTLVLTFGAGILLSRIADVSPATAAFGMIAGGAAGIVSIADELGADDRMVAVMQYLRVLMILALTPILAGAFFGVGSHVGGASGAHHVGYLQALLFLACCGPAGLLLARKLHFTAPTFFGPLAVGAALTLAGAPFAGQIPSPIQYLAFGVIGGKVGLDFTVESVRRARTILPAVLGVITLMLVACAALGLLLAPLAGVSALDGYLATTPGVLQVPIATAIGMKADTAFVLSAQVVRLMVMLVAAPFVARKLIPMPVLPAGGTPLEPEGAAIR